MTPLLLALLSLPVLAAGPADLVAQAIEAYGGRARLESVAAWRATGVVDSERLGRGETVRLWERDGNLDIRIAYPDKPERRVLVGPRGWRTTPEGFQAVDGPLLASMKLHAARLGLPWVLLDRGASARAAEPRNEGPAGVALGVGRHLFLEAWFDPDTHLASWVRTTLVHGTTPISFEAGLSDYRRVEGIAFPFAEDNFARGFPAGSTTLSEVELDPAVRPSAPEAL